MQVRKSLIQNRQHLNHLRATKICCAVSDIRCCFNILPESFQVAYHFVHFQQICSFLRRDIFRHFFRVFLEKLMRGAMKTTYLYCFNVLVKVLRHLLCNKFGFSFNCSFSLFSFVEFIRELVNQLIVLVQFCCELMHKRAIHFFDELRLALSVDCETTFSQSGSEKLRDKLRSSCFLEPFLQQS